MNITRVVWPRVTNLLDLRYFCQPNPLFYHLNLILCHYWSWRRDIIFLVNIFVQHTFSKSKSSIKRKTVLTMTDMTEYNEPLAFQRQKVGHKVTVKVSLVYLCFFYLETKSKSGKIYLQAAMKYTWSCVLVATVYRHKSLQLV